MLTHRHTGKHPPAYMQIHMHVCMHTHTQAAWDIFILSTSWAHIFFGAKHHPCASCALQLSTLVVPDPNRRMKATQDPSTFCFVLQGKIIIAPLGGPASSPEGPDKTRNVSQKPIKQQLFPVHHIKVWGTITWETERESSLKWSRRSVCASQFNSPDGQHFIQRGTWRSMFHYHRVTSIKTGIFWFMGLVELISGDYAA